MNDLHKFSLSVLVALSTVFALPTSAFALLDDFQDGNTNGWLETTIDGGRVSGGSYGVEAHNGSNMAFAYHYGYGSHALSMDITYSAAEVVSFDMHAVAVSVVAYFGSTLHARSGVTIAFLNQINIPLGTTGLYDVTDPSWLPAGSYEIDSSQHNYSGTMAFFASLAGLDPANPAIAKMSVSAFSELPVNPSGAATSIPTRRRMGPFGSTM